MDLIHTDQNHISLESDLSKESDIAHTTRVFEPTRKEMFIPMREIDKKDLGNWVIPTAEAYKNLMREKLQGKLRVQFELNIKKNIVSAMNDDQVNKTLTMYKHDSNEFDDFYRKWFMDMIPIGFGAHTNNVTNTDGKTNSVEFKVSFPDIR